MNLNHIVISLAFVILDFNGGVLSTEDFEVINLPMQLAYHNATVKICIEGESVLLLDL
jgi:hypothetical protein